MLRNVSDTNVTFIRFTQFMKQRLPICSTSGKDTSTRLVQSSNEEALSSDALQPMLRSDEHLKNAKSLMLDADVMSND